MQLDISELTPQAQTLLQQLQPGEEIVITAADQPAFRLIPINGHANGEVQRESAAPTPGKRKRRQAGSSDSIIWISPDFDEPLEDFEEYM